MAHGDPLHRLRRTRVRASAPGGVVVAGELRTEPPLDLSHVQARAAVRGACQALGDSDVRGLPPVGRGLGNLARALETMHEEEGTDV